MYQAVRLVQYMYVCIAASCIMSFRLFHFWSFTHGFQQFVRSVHRTTVKSNLFFMIVMYGIAGVAMTLYENVAHSEPELYTRPVDLRTQFDAFGCF